MSWRTGIHTCKFEKLGNRKNTQGVWEDLSLWPWGYFLDMECDWLFISSLPCLRIFYMLTAFLFISKANFCFHFQCFFFLVDYFECKYCHYHCLEKILQIRKWLISKSWLAGLFIRVFFGLATVSDCLKVLFEHLHFTTVIWLRHLEHSHVICRFIDRAHVGCG